MAPSGRARDSGLIDALEAMAPVAFDGPAWRVVRRDHDPIRCASAGGRWDDGIFEVLYTSLSAEGAVAEMHFHVLRGQPVVPSLAAYHLHELRIRLKQALKFADLEGLSAVGVDRRRFGQLSHAERQQEYPTSQNVAEAAHFLGYDGLIVPNARSECLNAVLFCGQRPPPISELTADHGPIDWPTWLRRE